MNLIKDPRCTLWRTIMLLIVDHSHNSQLSKFLGGNIFTVHNEVVARLYFHKRVSRILSTEGSASVHAGIHSPWADTSLGRHP